MHKRKSIIWSKSLSVARRSSYARATTSRTGVLDTAKLHTYRYNEDLFKKISVVPDGKNHGLVFILDWSGSMNNVLT